MSGSYFPEYEADHFSQGYTLSLEAKIALDIIRHCALVAAQEAGEDSTGRAKLGLIPENEVALRAANIAGHLTEEFRERGWVKAFTDAPEVAAAKIGAFKGIAEHAMYGRAGVSKELLGQLRSGALKIEEAAHTD